MAGIYSPRERIAIASSFEGIFNDGAPECALVSLNAYHEQDPRAFFGRKLTAKEFNLGYKGSLQVQAFLDLRPLVEVAEDYHTVLEVMRKNGPVLFSACNVINYNHLYSKLEKEFRELRENTKQARDAFGKGKESLFYEERKALQDADYEGWLNTQAPFEDTLPQFRLFIDTQVWNGNEPVSGFYPRLATSKDEASARALCEFYAKVKKLDPSDVEGAKCLIPRDGIIGMETVPDRNKVKQLAVIAERLDLPRSHVWRMNDRYDTEQQEELHVAGFTYQFFLPGYATPAEIEKAKTDKLVRVLDRKRFAQQIAAYAEEWGF